MEERELDRSGVELYIHIPYCVKKCNYCDFLSFPGNDREIHDYVRLLQKEIAQRASSVEHKEVVSIFFGGGTPSLINEDYIGDLLDTIRYYYRLSEDVEISLEVNPGTLTWEKLTRYKKSGVNRLSMGLQSTEDRLLKALGRIHTYQDFLESYDLARKAGFQNINVDLICGIPGQTIEDYRRSLTQIIRLKPEHISSYGLIIEPGTPYYDLYGQDEEARERGDDPQFLPSEEEERAMYFLTIQTLCSHGYENYEISNYARAGYACRHNVGYWIRREYLGLGLGASSFLQERRFDNPRDMDRYRKGIESGHMVYENVSSLSRREQMEEFMFLGLRMTGGISREDFRDRFGLEIEGAYGDVLTPLYHAGLLMQMEGRIFLTVEGIDVSNYVLAQFLREDD